MKNNSCFIQILHYTSLYFIFAIEIILYLLYTFNINYTHINIHNFHKFIHITYYKR